MGESDHIIPYSNGNGKPIVIVVEDDVCLNRLLQRIIARSGYKVAGATSGEKGIDLISSSQNSFLVLDYFLPDMNGNELVQTLRERSLEVPFLVLTGQGDERTAVDMMKHGAVDYVMKTPDLIEFIPQILQSAIEKVSASKKLARAEDELRKANEELETRVQIRTRELSETNLRLKREIEIRHAAERSLQQTMADLERSNSELEYFAYQAGHDLKEPIRKVLAFGNLLKESLESRLDDDQRENLDYLIDGAERMMKMIDGLLSYSRVTSKSGLFENIDPREVIDELIHFEIAEKLNETGGEVTLSGELPSLFGDRTQIHQLFQNLLSNALKFHRQGVLPKVTVFGKKNGKFIEFGVADNGIGIDEKIDGDIFTMFTRLKTSKCEGSGIGLAICKKIVDRHRGEIGYNGNPDGGTTFWFKIPYSNDDGP